jgi:hypothetical protein
MIMPTRRVSVRWLCSKTCRPKARRLQRSAADLEQVFIRSGKASQVRVSDIYLPWKHLFEVGFDVHVILKK